MEKNMKFISSDMEHRYLRKVAEEALDIEFTEDFNQIEKSDRTYIIWNCYGYLAHDSYKYKKKYEIYKKLKEQGKDVYIMERAALPNSIFIDRHGFLCDSSSYNEENWNTYLTTENKSKVQEYIKDIINNETSLEPQAKRISKEELELKLDITKVYDRVVFVPMQLHNDTVMILWADWIGNLKNFIDLTYQLAKKYPNVLFLVKNHPVEQDTRYHVTNPTNIENIKVVDDVHYKDCLSYCDIVMTINSGIGLQAMMWNKPVLLLGKCFYNFNEINYKVNNVNEIEELLFKVQKPNIEKMLRFIYYLRFVFYSVCFMKKLSGNASEPTLFEDIAYEDLQGKRCFIKQQATVDSQLEVLFDIINKLPVYSLMKITCLDCIRSHGLITSKNNLYIGTELNSLPLDKLKDYKYDISKQTLNKKGITVYLEPMPKETKSMTLYGEEVKVPMPVVRYLKNLYGNDWRNRNLKPITIAQTFNLHGWIFEFESLYYKKHSKLNIVPMLEANLKQCNKKNTDIVVIPSAWHFRDLDSGKGGTHCPIVKNMQGTIDYLKNQGIKIISQYNSHIEFPYATYKADLIVASSQKIYDYLKETYNYQNLIFLPHFVDTEAFYPKWQYNDFKIGWAGSLKNTYKRVHLLEQIDYPIFYKSDYKESLKYKGKQQGMNSFYNGCDVLLVTSKSEGSPMIILEAAACGKTVLSTDVGIAPLVLNPEFIIYGETEEEIVNNFNLKLEELEANPDKLLEEGKRNYEFVTKHFAWNSHVYILDQIYSYLLKNNFHKIKEISETYVQSIRN